MRVRKRVERAEATPAGDLLRFQRLVDNGQDLFYRYRINPLSIEYLSTAALAITGRDAQEFYDDPELGLSIVHPDDRDLLAGAIDAAGGSDPSKLRRTMLLRWIHRDGRIVWAEHQRVPVFDQHGRWVAVEGVARDVTDRVEAKRRLADSESLLRLLAENARDMIYRLAVVPHGLQYVSPAAERLTGRTPQEFLADPDAAWSAVHPEDREKARAMRTHPEASGDPVVLRWVHPDGSIVCVEHRNSPVYDASRQLIAFEGIGRDITEPLAIQTRLRDSESQLRRLAASLNSAREAERADVARELHDELGQTLTGLKLEYDAHGSRPDAPRPRTADDRSHAVDGRQHRGRHRDGAAPCLDAASAGARPSRPRRGDRARGGRDRAAHRRRCRIAGSVGDDALTSEQSTAVFRIVQEALTNVVRHANASAVKISMRQTTRSTSLTIADNGRGINQREVADPVSIGLLGMRERAQLIGAKLSISGRPGKGTAVVVTVPAGVARGRE